MIVDQNHIWVTDDDYAALKPVFESNWFSEGPQTAAFTNELLALIGTPYGVFAPSCTLGMFVAMKAMCIGPGDEVIVPATTFVASANAVELTGATPVFCDVHRHDYQIDLHDAERCLTNRTKAIMPVHLYGNAVNMPDVLRFATAHYLMVVEDAAQGIGVTLDGQHVGSWGHVGVFSFSFNKTITMGEGGFIVTRHKDIYDQLVLYRNSGRVARGNFIHPHIGYNFRVTELQTAFGRSQFARLDQIVARRRWIADQYRERLPFRVLTAPEHVEAVPFFAVMETDEPVEPLATFLRAAGIETRSQFYPLPLQPCFAHRYHPRDYPNAAWAFDHSLCLPCYPSLTDEQVDYICKMVLKYYHSASGSAIRA